MPPLRSGFGPKCGSLLSTAKDKLIVALMLMTRIARLHCATLMNPWKCSSVTQLFRRRPDVVRQIVSRGGRVFLDLKYHDIPNNGDG